MTPEALNDRLDAMQAAAERDEDKPGLITVQTDDWIRVVSAVRATCRALSDGLRHRDIVIHIATDNETAVLTRAQAGARGEPYRELGPRAS
jgi:hypothetical protein